MTSTLIPEVGEPDQLDAPARTPAAPRPSTPAPGQPDAGRLQRFARGRPEDPAWTRPALLVLLASTAVLYLAGLGASGWANTFYAAAAQAGSVSWKAFFFGSSDASNFITVDKTPASLWVMSLSGRIFGVNAWSLLVPQALMGVASVGVLYAAVKRVAGSGAGLLAGAVMALTPVSALMFRFNNPDALLVLLLTGAAYALVRALEGARTRWVVTAFALVGFAFLAKMLQAFLVVPGFGLVYLVVAPTTLRRRVGQLALGAAAMVAAGGWWVAIVELWPKSSRPYIGGSQNNSVLDLLFGYNGFGRLSGTETGSVGGGGNAGGNWGPTGWARLFNAAFGTQASWLIPASLLLGAGGLALTWRAARTDRARASLLLWGSWLVVTGATFSFGKGIIHPYYTVALTPAIGALVGIGSALLWRQRHHMGARVALVVTLAATAAWARVLLHRTPDWNPMLTNVVFVGGLSAAAALLLAPHLRGRVGQSIGAAALVLALAGPAASTVATAATPHSGAIPSVTPASASGFGGGLGGRAIGQGGGFGGGPGGFPGGITHGNVPRGATGGATPGGGGSTGGLLSGSTPSAELTAVLDEDASSYTWVAAAVGSNSAAGYQLATGDPVMAIGGFNGSDPTPTLAQFKALVAAGKIHYFIASGGFGGFGGGGSGSSTGSEISSWVTSTYTATTVGGVTLYDLTT